MLSLLDSILDAHDGGASVLSEQHDTGKIAVETSAITQALAGVAGVWDASEYGISAAEVQARIEAAATPEARERVMVELRARATSRASLDTSTGRVALMSARLLPWHGLGVVVDKATTSAEAIKYASLDWRVQKVAMQYAWNGVTRESKEAFAIVRADTGKQLATVGSRYAPIQNADAFGFMDELLKEYGARYETAGSLYGGEKVFMLAHFPQQCFSVNGKDRVEPYVAICNPHDGTGCANCFPTSVRIVCANTYRTAGSKGASKGLKIRHTGNVKSKIREARTALGMAVQSFDRFKDAADTMAHSRIEAVPYFNGVLDVTEAQMKRGFNPLESAMQATQAQLDLERKQFEAAAERRRDILSDILNRYESGTNGVGGMRGTAWSAFNAVTESADHAKIGTRRVGTLDDQRSRRFENVLAGSADEMKQAAFTLAAKA